MQILVLNREWKLLPPLQRAAVSDLQPLPRRNISCLELLSPFGACLDLTLCICSGEDRCPCQILQAESAG